ncbi:sodium:solute symporter family protein [Clostridium rectalis]|uniref:sodium:solute symporter family protein n=1 Tax=Clostridium rectalis TaxID=2040295 RepID=UPI000F63EDCF|nr:sodium:solute symporter family protein [Clostridium rectalis]
MPITLIIIILYMVIIMGVAVISSKKKVKNSKDFLLAGRNLGPFALAGTLAATEIGGGSTVGVAAKAYGEWGLSAGWYVVCCGVGIFLVSFIAPTLRKAMATTIPEIMERRYGKPSHIITTILSIVALFVATAVQIIATSTIISVVTKTPLKKTIIIAAVVITIYTMLGGLVSVAATDIIHIIFITVGMTIAMPIIVKNAGGWSEVKATLPPGQLGFTKVGWKTIIGLILMYFMTFSTGQEAVQRYFAARNAKIAKMGSFLCALIMALYGFVPAIIGLVALSKFPGIDANNAMATAAINFAPTIVAGLVLASVCAATMSSASGNMIAVSTLFTKDVYERYINKNATDDQLMIMSKSVIIFVGCVSLIIALSNTQIIPLLVFAFTIRSAGPFAAFVFGLLYKKATVNGGFYSLICGSIASFIWQYLNEPYGVMSVVFGSIVSTVVFFTVSLFERSKGVPAAPPAITKKHLDMLSEEQMKM